YLNLHGARLAGHPVQLIIVDEGGNADGGRAAVDKLIKENAVQAITGVASSEVMTGIRDQIESAQVPLIGSNASPSALGSVKYIWRTSYVNDEVGRALGGYLGSHVGQSAYVISDESSLAHEQVVGFTTTFLGLPKHPSLADDPVTIPLSSNPGMSLGGYLSA